MKLRTALSTAKHVARFTLADWCFRLGGALLGGSQGAQPTPILDDDGGPLPPVKLSDEAKRMREEMKPPPPPPAPAPPRAPAGSVAARLASARRGLDDV